MHRALQRLSVLSTAAKGGLVAAGYVAALLLAFFSVWLQADPIDADASAGMQAFGDVVLFFAVLGVGSAFPTALMLFFWCRKHA
jgi:hypothetical protein